MCGLFFWGVWWIVPLVAFFLCFGFTAFGFLGTGRGFMCMGDGQHSTPTDQVPQSHG